MTAEITIRCNVCSGITGGGEDAIHELEREGGRAYVADARGEGLRRLVHSDDWTAATVHVCPPCAQNLEPGTELALLDGRVVIA